MLNVASSSIRTRCRGTVIRHGLKTLSWRCSAAHNNHRTTCKTRDNSKFQRFQHTWSYESRIFEQERIPPDDLQYDNVIHQSDLINHEDVSGKSARTAETQGNELIKRQQHEGYRRLELSNDTEASNHYHSTSPTGTYIPSKSRPKLSNHRYNPGEAHLVQKGFSHLISHAKCPDAAQIALRYIEKLPKPTTRGEQLSNDLLEEIEPHDMKELQKHGYDVDDLRAWIEFLAESNDTTAVHALRERLSTRGMQAFPFSIIYRFLEQRKSLHTVSLGLLINQIRDLFSHARLVDKHPVTINELCDTVYHLLRHARRATPLLFEAIAKLLMENILEPEAQTFKYRQDVSRKVNELTTLFSAPVATRPYEAASLQQAVIIQILQFVDSRVAGFQVTRAAYRALARVQLAQAKTGSEKDWACLKALSWPPWKEDKLGIDSLITPETHGISAAGQTIKRATEAGYAKEQWENISEMFSGWDDDGTPTIQTRAILWSLDRSQTYSSHRWAARIRCTRTIQEAWACWLAYELKMAKKPPELAPTFAIFEKLHQAERLSAGTAAADLRSRLPGDVKELSNEPPSTHLHTYTRTHPPSVREFFSSLQGKKISSLLPFLPFVIPKATTIDEAVFYLRSSDSAEASNTVKLLLGDATEVAEIVNQEMVAASIELLCKLAQMPWHHSPEYDQIFNAPHGLVMPKHLQHWHFQPHHSMLRAVYVLQHQKDCNTPLWLPIFNLLANSSVRLTNLVLLDIWPSTKPLTEERFAEQLPCHHDFLAILNLRLAQQILQMLHDRALTIDLPIFNRLCTIVSHYSIHYYSIVKQNATLDAPQNIRSWYQSSGLNAEILATDRVSLSRFLMQQFYCMLGLAGEWSLEDVQKVIQSPLIIMSPAPLHSWARAVGTLGDHSALLELVRLVCNEKLVTIDMSALNAQRGVRQFVTSLRVFLERSWLGEESTVSTEDETWSTLLHSIEESAPKSVVQEVKSLIEARFGPDLGRWPDVEEIEAYVRKGAYKKLGLM